MAIHDEQINELTEQIQAARDALDLETVAELEAQRDQLINQKNFENSAAGQLAESTLDEVPAPNTAEQELTDEEVNKINSSGGGSSGLNLTPIAALVGAAAIDQAIKKSKAESEADEDETPAADNTQEVGDNNAGSSESQTKASEAPVGVKVAEDKKSNILHNYDSYTYRISLYALSAVDYNSMTKNPTSFVPKTLLIQSGGGVGETGSRHPDFQEDFYFENLNMQTMPGLNAQTKASNALMIDFTIIEPLGLTLLNRLMSVCLDLDQCTNYVEQPYLLEVDFIPANGNGPIENTKKRIPIKILKIQASPSSKGTVYKCIAMPFNHSAFQETVAKLPIGINVTAETIKDFFDADILEENFIADIEERIESEARKLKSLFLGESSRFLGSNNNALAPVLSGLNTSNVIGNATSYPGAYNTFFEVQATKNANFNNPQIRFQFDKAFINSKIVRPEDTNPSKTPMGKQGENHGPGSVEKKKEGFVIPAGTDVIEVIDRVMRRSDYIIGQIRQRGDRESSVPRGEDSSKEFKFLDWFKIVPQVQLLKFDGTSSSYKKVVTYYVQKYQVANSYHPAFKLTKVGAENIVRSYQYLYTGQNTDILDFDIDFNALYYTALTAFHRSKIKNNERLNAKDPGYDAFLQDNESVDNAGDKRQLKSDLPMQTKIRGSNQSESGQLNRAEEDHQQRINDLVQSIYTTAVGDMLNCDIKIIGDPALIKQDDNYYTPAASDYKNFSTADGPAPINPVTGQVIYDNKQVYIQIYFNDLPTDIDDVTGITNKEIKLKFGKAKSAFSGIYKVLKVENKFSNGEFTQVLRTIRMPNELPEDVFEEDKDKSQENENRGIALLPEGESPLPSNPVTNLPDGVADNGQSGTQGEEKINLQAAANSPGITI